MCPTLPKPEQQEYVQKKRDMMLCVYLCVACMGMEITSHIFALVQAFILIVLFWGAHLQALTFCVPIVNCAKHDPRV